jgi:hypothetical protein
MDGPVSARDRRRAARRVPDPEEPLSHVRLRAGRELLVVDLSPAGALVEGETRLLPGTHVDVHVLTSEGRVLVRSRVVRACVSALWSDRVQYRGALAFDRPVNTGYAVPIAAATASDPAGTHYPLEAA